jgi:hypothetical protein
LSLRGIPIYERQSASVVAFTESELAEFVDKRIEAFHLKKKAESKKLKLKKGLENSSDSSSDSDSSSGSGKDEKRK